VTGRIVATATGSLVNTATIAPPAGTDDVNTVNNSATDTDTIIPKADLSITKNDGVTTIAPGQTNQYTIVVSNAGPSAVTNASVIDTLPALPTGMAGLAWKCTAGACGAALGTGNLNTTVSLLSGQSATYVTTVSLSSTAPLTTVSNTVRVAFAAGDNTFDPNLGNNAATDTDLVRNATLPTVPLRDSFDRDGPALGANWSVTGTNTRITGDAAQGFTNSRIMWNGANSPFGAKQAAAFTYRNAPVNNAAYPTGLVLKASGGTLAVPATYASVTYNTGVITVSTVTTSGAPIVQGTKAFTLVNGDRLTALADGLGNVFLFRTNSGGTTTYIGVVAIPIVGALAWAPASGGGRVGLQVPAGQRVDDFRAGTIA
jgi:uncharacterized repeat protein (TIGR01451 family)